MGFLVEDYVPALGMYTANKSMKTPYIIKWSANLLKKLSY